MKPALALALLLLQHPPAMPTAEPIAPLDTRLETLPVAWYGSRWPPRSAALIERMARMTVVILMQQDDVGAQRAKGPGPKGPKAPKNQKFP